MALIMVCTCVRSTACERAVERHGYHVPVWLCVCMCVYVYVCVCVCVCDAYMLFYFFLASRSRSNPSKRSDLFTSDCTDTP